MQLGPVIERELRVQARNRATFGLRVAVAGAAALALAVAVSNQRAPMVIGRTRLGPWLFACLHTAICVVLAVSCPFLAADALARERREGTLGILLLTPLDPAGVVLGKMCVHLLRALTPSAT